ncbi:MAG: LptF/LptG family permease [Myxococcota bacterium]
MRIFERYVAGLALGIFAALSLGLVALFLVIDFGDWLRIYTGKPVSDVLTLYWYRSHVSLVQFAPAALVLSAGLTITVVRRRGEWTALRALGASWLTLVRPITVVCVASALALLLFQELVVADSGPKIDRMMVEKFGRWGDFTTVYSPRRWFRAGSSLLNVRGEANPERLEDVRIFELDERSSLRGWIEARRLVYVRDGTWRVEEGDELLVDGPEAKVGRRGEFELRLPIRPEVTQLAVGRPEWLPMRVLAAQVPLMTALELPTEATRFAVHQRWAQALSAVLAALVAAMLGLRATVKPSVPRALIEGAALYGGLFLAGMISRSLAINGRVEISLAAWGVPALLVGLLVALRSRAGAA